MANEKNETVKKQTVTKKTNVGNKKTNTTTKKTQEAKSNKKAGTTKTIKNNSNSTKKTSNTAKKSSSTVKNKKTTTSKKQNNSIKESAESKAIEPIKVETKEEVTVPLEISAKNKEAENCTILGVALPTGTDKVDTENRIKLYMKDSLVFSIIIPILDLLAMLFIKAYKPYPITNNIIINCFITLLIDFILIFVLTFSVDYIHGERIVKRINNKK